MLISSGHSTSMNFLANQGYTQLEMRDKHEQFDSLLSAKEIDVKEVKKICLSGCPDTSGIRSKCWKIMLDYFPKSACTRDERLSKHRREYAGYVKDFVVESGRCTASDHPLNPEPSGEWINFFNDNEVLLQINKDCRRLCPDFDFFHRSTEFPCSVISDGKVSVSTLRRRVETSSLQSRAVDHNLIGVTSMIRMPTYDAFCPANSLTSGLSCLLKNGGLSKRSDETNSGFSNDELHWEVIQRILFVYYKTHVGQGYVQGMNEVIAPIYYVFATDPDINWRRYAEADTFFCFNNLMTEIHPNFIRKLDNGQPPGIGGQLQTLMDLVARFDRPLYAHMTEIGLAPEHFAFRWVSLLLSREFLLPEVIRLWDTLFADEHRFDMLRYVCCSMLILIREELLQADFPTAVNLVQHYPPEKQMFCILSKARVLYSQRH
ncbi:unnamed protein product [Calicophoron daubneyi]|uniref:Rab-GAP TBC domain-containing protein n=1 Tax=Calicophoron daubneyi TaxID=300641 RepID=A0AAV2TBY9_CALDB